MAEFFAELKRRQIYRVGAAYVVVAWVLTQGISILAQVFMLPTWIAQAVIVLLAIGFPVALVTAWMVESKPHEAVASAVKAKPTILDGALFGALIVVGLLIGYQQIAPTRQVVADAVREAATSPATAVSIAVLPFSNLSGDASQEFFSDGITEEITSALARVPDLRVVARTSAYQFRAQNRDIQSIAQQLKATHFIEGSVRKAGERVRITAQLIRAEDATPIWSENYDRQLADIFAVQEEIARTITTSLRMPLGLRPGENLVSNRSIDLQAYELYLQARALVTARGSANLTDAARMLEQVVTRNPDYAPAWGVLSESYFLIALQNAGGDGPIDEVRRTVGELMQKADVANERTTSLDPNSAFGYGGAGIMAWSRGRILEGEALISKALAIDPDLPEVLGGYGIRLAVAGRLREGLAAESKYQTLEPLHPNSGEFAAELLWLNGKTDEAIALAKTLRPIDRGPALADIYASMGRFEDAADALTERSSGAVNSDLVREAIRILRTTPPQAVPPQSPSRFLRALDFYYLRVGAPQLAMDRVLSLLERRSEIGLLGGQNGFMWHPAYAPMRKTERFKVVMGKLGYVEYWRAKGWPEFCKPVGADDFVCE